MFVVHTLTRYMVLNNMKTRCYPKYSYIAFIVLSIIMFVFSIAPLIIKADEDIIAKTSWSLIMAIMGVIFIIASIQYMQYYYVDGNYIVVKAAFGTIMKLDALNIQISIETLPTYFSWIVSIDKKWICIYDKILQNENLFKFQSGCSNNKKLKRIQIIYNEKNIKAIEQWAEKFNVSK